MKHLQHCLVVLSLATFTLAAIRPIHLHKDGRESKIRADPIQFDGVKTAHETKRHPRSSDIPMSTRAAFNDSNTFVIISYSGSDSQVIFAMTYETTFNVLVSTNLYRSDDYGASFSFINGALGDENVLLSPTFFFSPESNDVIILAHSFLPRIYISEDEGVTFIQRTLTTNDSATINPQTLLFHPTQESWFLVHDPINDKLYLSMDLGLTPLTLISDNVVGSGDYQWGVAPYDDEGVIYYNKDDPDDDSNVLRYFYTHDVLGSGSEFDTNLGDNDAFLLLDRYIFLQKTVDDVITLWISYDRNSFQQALIPQNAGHQSYTVASIASLHALVIVEHTDGVAHLYTSDETGFYFSLSLANINNLVGVESVNLTTYIANQIVDGTLRTRISYDLGGNWEAIESPELDSEDNLLNCDLPLCSLHLDINSVYSQDSAPGIILANGATGASLDTANNLYISRDGGITWQETLKSTWGVSVLDHGGLLVAAQDVSGFLSAPSSSLFYSCDEGDTWSEYVFSSTLTVVFGVITEPGETTTVVSLFGTDNFGTLEWVVIVVDFADVFEGLCNSTDYYNWIPYDVHSDTGCLLGASVTLERRIPGSCCLNDREYERVVSYEVCECTTEDFECDYGYRPADGLGGYCVRDESVTLPNLCKDGDLTYYQSQGYRKIAGDVCTGGIESNFDPVLASCCPDENKGATSSPTSMFTRSSTSTSMFTRSSTSTSMFTTSSTFTTSTSVLTSSSTFTTSTASTSTFTISSSTFSTSANSPRQTSELRPTATLVVAASSNTAGISAATAVLGVLLLVAIVLIVILAVILFIKVIYKKEKYNKDPAVGTGMILNESDAASTTDNMYTTSISADDIKLIDQKF